MRLLHKLSSSCGGAAAASLLFFVLYYLYLWLVIDLRLFYHGGGLVIGFPVFYRGWEFFRDTAFWPGGLVEYVSAFLAQFFFIGWTGALVATMQAWLMWLCTVRLVRVVSGWLPRWVSFIPPILLLMFYAGYSYQFTAAMTLLSALVFVCLYVSCASRSKTAGLLVFPVLSIIVYATTGVGYLLFAALCAIYELLVRRRWLASVVYLLLVPILLRVACDWGYGGDIVDVLWYIKFYSELAGEAMLTTVYALYLFVPAAVFGLWLIRRFGLNQSMRFEGMVWKIIGLVLPFVLGVTAADMSHRSDLKTVLEVDYYACNKMWPEVLKAAGGHPQINLVNHSVNRALYHMGRLADDMFAYPQRIEAMFLNTEASWSASWKLTDTLIDLGYMNLADLMLISSMESFGERPLILKRLALVNMVKGDIGVARVYLGSLSKTLFDASWAKSRLEKIDSDPELSTDAEIQRLRSMMPKNDRCSDIFAANLDMYLALLESNRHNRMAFEYLMAIYLLSGRFDDFVGNMDRLDDFDYAGIPRVYEEAILFSNFSRNKQIEIPGREIRAQSRERFDNFMKVKLGRTGRMAGFDELARDYGDTYLFYCFYRQSGMKK